MSDKHQSELNDIIEGFQMFSSDTDGLINPNELKEIMETMNMNEKNPFLYNIINQLCSNSDINQKGGIDPGDFISLLDQELNDTSSIEGLEKIFNALYTPSTNTILLQNIPKIVKNIEKDEEIKTLFSKPEINGKEIDFNEFVEIMKKDGDSPKISKTEKVYKKKTSMGEGRESYHNEKKITNNNDNNINNINNEKNDFINSDIKKVEINFNNNMINNNSKNNSQNNLNNSMNSTEKMEIINISGNRSSLHHFNDDKNNENGNTNENDMVINNDINNFDNNNYKKNKIEYNEELKEEEITSKKKYRHMRKTQNKELNEENINNELNENKGKYVLKKQINISYKTRGRINNNDQNNEFHDNNNQYKEDKNDDNEDSDFRSSKRYHRRYRDIKSNYQDKKEEKENNDNIETNNKTSSNYSKYRRKK